MAFTNPYEAPETDEVGERPSDGPLEVIEERSSAGSSMRIGPRRAFTAAWIARGDLMRGLGLAGSVILLLIGVERILNVGSLAFPLALLGALIYLLSIFGLQRFTHIGG